MISKYKLTYLYYNYRYYIYIGNNIKLAFRQLLIFNLYNDNFRYILNLSKSIIKYFLKINRLIVSSLLLSIKGLSCKNLQIKIYRLIHNII